MVHKTVHTPGARLMVHREEPGVLASQDLVRIGDKVIQRSRLIRFIDDLLARRVAGLSQLEAARELGVDRTLVSRLESIGEVRRGARLALIGFPIANRRELYQLALSRGVDFILLMSNQERWDFVAQRDGASLFNQVLDMISLVKRCDAVIFLGSDRRVRMMEEIVGRERLVGVELGPSPLEEDQYVEPERLAEYIDHASLVGPRDEGAMKRTERRDGSGRVGTVWFHHSSPDG